MGGILLSPESKINYRGISAEKMRSNYSAETLYSAEVDIHFPNMTVGDTLDFAGRARAPRTSPGDLSAREFAAMPQGRCHGTIRYISYSQHQGRQ